MRDWLYGWIQGRGLEALTTHARRYEQADPGLAVRLDGAGRALYAALDELWARDGHGYFCYDADLRPVYPTEHGVAPQALRGDVYTYSDAFFAKGLICGAARYSPKDVPRHLGSLGKVIAAIEDDRFQMAEKVALDPATARAEPADFGPRMILLGAAGMLARLDLGGAATEFADRFIHHILDHHHDPDTNLLRNVPGQDDCNVGHGIEFVGFALDHLPADASPETVARLERILVASFDLGFQGPGICLIRLGRDRPPRQPLLPLVVAARDDPQRGPRVCPQRQREHAAALADGRPDVLPGLLARHAANRLSVPYPGRPDRLRSRDALS